MEGGRWNGKDCQPTIGIFSKRHLLKDRAADGNMFSAPFLDRPRGKFRRSKERLGFVSRRQRQLDLVNAFDEHQSIYPALTFVIAQFDDMFNARVLQARNIHYVGAPVPSFWKTKI